MEFSNTDDVALELSTIIQEISVTNNEIVKFPNTESKSPASYKQIMQTKFPPNSPKFAERKTHNNIDPDIINTVAGLNIYNRQVFNMKEVDKITCYYPDFDNLHPAAPDEEKSNPDKAVDNQAANDEAVMNNKKENNSYAGDPWNSETSPFSQEKSTDNQGKDNDKDNANSDAPLLTADDSNDDQSVVSYENGEPNEKNIKKPYSEDLKESDKSEDGTTESHQDVKFEKDSKVRDESPKSSPCCYLFRSKSNDELNEDTEYEPKNFENDKESELPDGDMESSDEEKELPSEDREYDKFGVENDKEKLLSSEGPESDMSSMGIDEEEKPVSEELEYVKLSMDNKIASAEKNLKSATSEEEENEVKKDQEQPENSEFSDVNLKEEYENSFKSNFKITPLDSVENQDNLLSSNKSKKKKKSSIFKRLFSRKRN